MKVSDMSANSPVGSTLAILERTLKVMSAVNARIYYSMKKEFLLLKNIIRDYTDPEYRYDPSTGTPGAKQEDYNKVNLIPVADPNASTMAQKVVQYQAVMQMAQQNPAIYDLPELNRQMLTVLGIKDINKLIPDKDNVKPADPVTENMNMINGKPVKAFMFQDQQAHIDTHMAFKNDPVVAQIIGQGPKATQIANALEAHIAEHLAFLYRSQLEEQLGVPLPPLDEPLPVNVENDLSRMIAMAGQQLLQKNNAEIKQQQNQQLQQDPIVQMQQQELQIKQMEAQSKVEKTKADIKIDMARLELDTAKLSTGVQMKGAELMTKTEIEGAKLELQAATSEQNAQVRGVQLGMDDAHKKIEQTLKLGRLEMEAEKSDLEMQRNSNQATKLKDETQLNERE